MLVIACAFILPVENFSQAIGHNKLFGNLQLSCNIDSLAQTIALDVVEQNIGGNGVLLVQIAEIVQRGERIRGEATKR